LPKWKHRLKSATGCLNTTRDIWKGLAESSNTSMEAVKASNILDIMLNKITKPSTGNPTNSQQQDAAANAGADPFRGTRMNDEMQSEHSAAVTLGMLSGGVTMTPGSTSAVDAMIPPVFDFALGSSGSGMTPDFTGDMLSGDQGPASPFSMFNSMGSSSMDFTSNFDWASPAFPYGQLLFFSS